MRITFIRPSMIQGHPGDSLEPLVFGVLSRLTPPDIARVLYDQRKEPIPFDEATDLAVLSVDTFTARSAYQIALRYRSRGVPVIMGGHHATLCPDEALQFADSVAIGDAEGTWPEAIEDARKGTLKRLYQGKERISEGVQPDRSVFRTKRYLPAAMVQFGRGCKYACDFCSVHAFYGNSIRHRPVGEVLREIRDARRKHIILVDDNLFAVPAAARELINALKPLGVRWACQASLDIAEDEDLVHAMAESGCLSVTVGFESMSEENLLQMRKSWNRVHGPYEELVRVFRRHGIMVYGAFVFGYDYDTVDSFRPSVEFAVEQKLMTANFNPLAPTPGTRLYERLKHEKRLTFDRWWIDPDFRYGQSYIHPKQMTAPELACGCYWARRQFNTYASILRRSLDLDANFRSPDNARIFLAVNMINKRELERKQGRRLGDGTHLGVITGEDR